jgi:periplasmic protein TonB
MNLKTRKNILFENACFLSLIAHMAGICFLFFLVPSQKLQTPETNPIQIKNIIFQPIPKPKNVKPLQPVPEVLASRSKTEPSPHNPRSYKTFSTQIAHPTVLQNRLLENKIQKPNYSTQPLQVSEVSTSSMSKPSTLQAGLPSSKSRKSNSVPVRYVESIVPHESSQKPALTMLSRKFNSAPVPTSQIGIRNISTENNLIAASPIHEVPSTIKGTTFRQISPIQQASITSSFVDVQQKKASRVSKDLGYLGKGFSSNVRGKIAIAKYYPGLARRKGWEGKPVIEFLIGKNGELLDYSIAVSSSYEILDQAALDAVKKASPYPKIPELLQQDSIRFKLPISFKLKEP